MAGSMPSPRRERHPDDGATVGVWRGDGCLRQRRPATLPAPAARPRVPAGAAGATQLQGAGSRRRDLAGDPTMRGASRALSNLAAAVRQHDVRGHRPGAAAARD